MAARKDDRTRALIAAAYGASLAVIVGSALLGEPYLWGANWYGFLPRYSLLLPVVLGVAAYFVSRLFSAPVRKDAAEPPASNGPCAVVAILVVALFGIAYVLFRNQTHFLGDGYQVLAKLETGGGVVKPWNLAVNLGLKVVMALFSGTPDGALMTFRVVSIGSGVLDLGIAALVARSLRPALTDRLLLLLGVATGGYTLLYFGYVEYYPLFVTAVLMYLLFGLMALQGALNRWWVLPPLVLAGLCHPYTVALFPAALYLFLRDRSVGLRLGRLSKATWFSITAVLLIIFIAALYFLSEASYFFRLAILPVVTNRFTMDGYTMLSFRHLSDLINLLFMLVPSLLILLAVVGSSSFRTLRRTPPYRFLLLSGLFALILTFVFDPKLGMPRDWDLFGFVGLPPLLLLFYFLTDSRSSLPGRRGAAVMAVALGLLVLAPRVATQMEPERSIAVFDSFSAMDLLRNESGRTVLLKYLHERGRDDEAERRVAQSEAQLPHKALARQGQEALAQKNYGQALMLLRRVTELAPNWWGAWTNLGACYLQINQLDSAENCLRIADGINPYSVQIYNYLAVLYLMRGEFQMSERYCRSVLEIDPGDFNSRGTLLQIYEKTRRIDDYRRLVYAMAEEENAPAGLVLMAAQERLNSNNIPEAIRLYRVALVRGADTTYIREIEGQHPGLKIIP